MLNQSLNFQNGRDKLVLSVKRRMIVVSIVGVALILLCVSATPVVANVFSKLGRMYGCIVTWGQVCDLSDTVVGTGQSPQPIPVTCSQPLLNGLPQFLSWPKGSAKYRFQGTCSSPARPGAVMTVRWEGSWIPSETKTDRPNASETLEITGFEAFLPDRAPGGKIYMYWTTRCTRDPWLQSGACTPFGAFVPEDLRQAFSDIDKQSFPRTGTIISATDKNRLFTEYQRVNPSLFISGSLRSNLTTKAFQPPIAQSPGVGKRRFLSRGIEPADQPPSLLAEPEHQKRSEQGTSSADDLLPESNEPDHALPQVTVTVEQPLHFLSAKGEDTELQPGIYEIELVLDLQLILIKEDQAPVVLPAIPGTHSESFRQPVAVIIQGDPSEKRHLMLLLPDGKRYEAVGSTRNILSPKMDATASLPEHRFKEAILQISAKQAVVAAPYCQPSSLPVGPRWLPVLCTMHTGTSAP